MTNKNAKPKDSPVLDESEPANEVVLDENGTVHVCEQDEPEGWEDSYDEEEPYDVINAMLPAE